MEKFFNKDGSIILKNLIKTIQDNKEYLGEVDGAIGDGDHGINMNKGFTICEERIAQKEINFTLGFEILGNVLLMEIGGSMGPLYGSFFKGMSKTTADKEELNKEDFLAILDGAYNGLRVFDKAQVGDKTLMDCLIPAINAYKAALEEGKGFAECLEAMKKAAEEGKESTKDMVAKLGRASRLGERSRGVLDAGATSCNLILQSFANSVLELI